MPRFFADLLERAAATYVQAFIGFLIAGATEINVSALESAALAAIPAALSVVKSLLASRFGDSSSASLVPVVPPPHQEP